MIPQTNRIWQRLRQGEVAIGATVQMASPESVEMVGHAGFDYVWIDAEHGIMDITTIANLIRAADACGMTSVVRVPDLTPSFISRVLDAGALGILAPHVRTRADAESLVRSVKYGPTGVRGACPMTRATGHMVDDWASFAARANRETMAWAIIEDVEAVDNIEEIVSVEGLDAILLGPFDLSQAMGLDGDVHHPVLRPLIEKVESAARARNVEIIALPSWAPDGLENVRKSGARIINYGSDRAILAGGLINNFRKAAAVLRDE